MQLCDITILLNGDRNFAIQKQDVPVAEIVLLRLLHGEEAVQDIRPTRTDTRTLRSERERLLRVYGAHKADIVNTIDSMFRDTAVQGLTRMRDLALPGDVTEKKPTASKRVSAADIPDGDAEGDARAEAGTE